MQINLSEDEAKKLTVAITQLINERDLEAAISLLQASIEFSGTENIELREMMFGPLFGIACANPD